MHQSEQALVASADEGLRERVVVNRQQGQQLAGQMNMPHFETSAIDGYECDAPFAALAKMLHGSGGGEQEMTHDRNPLMSRPQS